MLQVTWLGHSTVVMEVGGRRLITDPLLRRHSGPLRRRGRPPLGHQWQDVDAVLLSHLHHDHAELRSLRMLGDVPVLTGPANAAWLLRRGLGGVVLEGWCDLGGGVSVRLVKAVHHARPMPHRPNEAHGHLLRTAEAAVWVAGDTELYDEMTELPGYAGRDRLDLAVVPVGGWGPRLSPGHMGPEEAAAACAMTRARWALPYHWGTHHAPLVDRLGDWMDRPLVRFEEALARTAPGCRVVRAAPGGSPVSLGRADG